MLPTNIEVSGQTYRIGALSPIEQFHVLRRLAPIMSTLGNAHKIMEIVGRAKAAKEAAGEAAADEGPGAFALLMGPMLEAASGMPEEHVNYIIFTCMSACQRQGQGTAGIYWQPLLAADGKSFMFADMTMADMLKIVSETVQGNLGNFFDLLVDLA